MAKIPTTEMCPQCAKETPEMEVRKSGRRQIRLYQDLDTQKFECAVGHVVDLAIAEDPAAPAESEAQEATLTPSPAAAPAREPENDTTVAVAEPPELRENLQSQIVPGSTVVHRDGALEMRLLIPEQYVGPLQGYCEGIGKSVEEFVNEVVANGFENGWFV